MLARFLITPALPVEADLVASPFCDCGGMLIVNGEAYAIDGPDECEVRRLFKIESQKHCYSVWETEHGLHGCTCPDFEMRSGRNRQACKHISALYRVGLLTRFPPPGCTPQRSQLSTLEEVQ